MGFARMQDREQESAWLAMRFGCCASGDDAREESSDALQARGEPEMQICYEQPRSVPQPCAEPIHPRPSTSHSVGRHVSQWVSNSREFASSSRASFSTLSRPGRSHSRPSIGHPTDFRRFDSLGGIQSMIEDAPAPVRRRRSFRPLELSIYLPDGCGRLSPLPDFEELEVPAQAVLRVRDSRTNSLSSDPSSCTYLIQRKPVGACSRRSSVQSTSTQERRLSGTTMATMTTPTLNYLPEETRTSAEPFIERPSIPRRSRTSGTLSPARVLSRLPSPSRSRANTAPTRPGSLRRPRTDVDEAIRELNTIVEERRASAYRSYTQSPALINRPPPSPSHHVPYIAPSMRIHVRSETLSDIGSAFSAPVNKAIPSPPTGRMTLAPPPRTYVSGALTSNPITPPAPVTPTSATTTSRLGAWLKRSASSLTPTSPASFFKSSQPPTPQTADSFYRCEPTPSHPSSRPSTAGSRTICHVRQTSQDSDTTATVTLFSAHSTSPSLSSTTTTSSPPRKTKRVPAPLTLIKDKQLHTQAPLHSAKSTRSTTMLPPPSPNYGLLRGMEKCGRDVSARGSLAVHSPGAVGVAF
ncbi:hypothetical protein ACN47E_003491 [Coniothyrium glycines]